ncbi:hypothetical protein HDR58_05885 [bacterium]|nr:hypothetical protein [bacterium]
MKDYLSLLNNIKTGYKITENLKFLKFFDQSGNNNSIFDKFDMAKLKTEVSKFAAKDGNADDLSTEEMIDFYNYTMSNVDKEFKKVTVDDTEIVNNLLGFFKSGEPAEDENFEISEEDMAADMILFNDGEEDVVVSPMTNDSPETSDITTVSIAEDPLREVYSKDEILESLQILLTPEEFPNADYFLDKYSDRTPQLSNIDIALLVKVGEHKLDQIDRLMNLENLETQLKGQDVAILADIDPEVFENLKEFLNVKGRVSQFTANDILDMAGFTPEQIQKVRFLCNMPNRDAIELDPTEIIALVNVLHPDLDNFIDENPDFTIEAINEKNATVILSSEDNLYAFDSINGLFQIQEILRNNDNDTMTLMTHNKLANIKQISTKIPDPIFEGSYILDKEEVQYFDEKGNLKETLNLIRGVNDGVIDVSRTLSDGTVIPVQHYTIDEKTGNMVIEKNLESPDGTSTEYYYEESENLQILSYKITDKNGDLLMYREQTIQQLGPNSFISSINDHAYCIKFEDSNITVFDEKSGKTAKIPIDGKVSEESRDYVLAILRQVPGNQLMLMDRFPINKILVGDGRALRNNAFWCAVDKEINISELEGNEDFLDSITTIFMHEYGHYVDTDAEGFIGDISGDETLDMIYQEELKNFYKYSTIEQQDYIDYFTTFDGAAGERVAETNLLTNTKPNGITALRSFYLQMFFPKTIAKISELIRDKEESVV